MGHISLAYISNCALLNLVVTFGWRHKPGHCNLQRYTYSQSFRLTNLFGELWVKLFYLDVSKNFFNFFATKSSLFLKQRFFSEKSAFGHTKKLLLLFTFRTVKSNLSAKRKLVFNFFKTYPWVTPNNTAGLVFKTDSVRMFF